MSTLLTQLSCTAFPTWEALYKQFGNLCLLCRESMFCAAGNRDTPTQLILRQAPLVSSPEEDQFDVAVVDQVSAVAQTRSHQNTALCTLVMSKSPKPTQRSVRQSQLLWRTWPWTKRTKAPFQAFFPREG